MKQIPRNQHPKPQMKRAHWLNLNGEWDFEIDNSCSGYELGYANCDACFSKKILVPFCPESKLSQIENKDFMNSVWYQKKINLNAKQIKDTIFLHFGAVDYLTKVYVNGSFVGEHKGGYVSFKFDISQYVKLGENIITVNANDDTRNPMIPSGKQSSAYHSKGCFYTRTSGIWQTVWLEFVPENYIENIVYDSDIHTGFLSAKLTLKGKADLKAKVTYKKKIMAEIALKEVSGTLLLPFHLKEIHLWEVGHGRLYDIEFEFGKDKVQSYYGLRSIELQGYKFLINGKSVFQRLVLDQGFYEEGIYTAPSDTALRKDIDCAMALGFNGARLHEKVFEERYLYYADKKGYLVWGEYPNWGLDHTNPIALYPILNEWVEEVKRDQNHPSIIGWCPFNETWDEHDCKQHDDLLRQIYKVTKAIDPSRPCIDTSGNYHVETDIFDVHDYNQNPIEFKNNYDEIIKTGILYDRFLQMEKNSGLNPNEFRHYQEYRKGQPTFVSEYGGIRWTKEMANSNHSTSDKKREKSWGYGKDVQDMQEFKERFKALSDALLDNPCFFGFCYTQLTDVEQEQNGLYTYDRTLKFDSKWIKSVLSRKAAIED